MAVVVKSETIQIGRYELGPFGTNSYIMTCLKTGDSVVFDAPGDAPKILGQLEHTNPKYILMTHNHMDHTGALAELKSALKVPIAAHAADAARLPHTHSAATMVIVKPGALAVMRMAFLLFLLFKLPAPQPVTARTRQ